ncbi:MAG: hypothetical protein PHC60_08135 [Heliobacteriaceae bacterium]|nr:hypothetical protein [Heliobacteriaceae bacterium]
MIWVVYLQLTGLQTQPRNFRDLLLTVTPTVEPTGPGTTFITMAGPDPQPAVTALFSRLVPAYSQMVRAGIASNKFLAKAVTLPEALISFPPQLLLARPKGGEIILVPPGQEGRTAAGLPVNTFWPLPPATRKELTRRGIRNGRELLSLDLPLLTTRLGWEALLARELAQGRFPGRVRATYPPAGQTWQQCWDPPLPFSGLFPAINQAVSHLAAAITEKGLAAQTLSLRLENDSGRTVTAGRRLNRPAAQEETLARLYRQLAVEATETTRLPAPIPRLTSLCLEAGDLVPAPAEQLPLFVSLPVKKPCPSPAQILTTLSQKFPDLDFGRQKGPRWAENWRETRLGYYDPWRAKNRP